MKTGISFIKESEKGLLIPLEASINKSKIDAYDYCYLDYDTWEDFIDYCDFQGYSAFVFISNGERIIEICKRLNLFYEKEIFCVYDEHFNFRYGKTVCLDDVCSFKDVPFEFNEDNSLDQGSYAFTTGIYPPNISNNVLKHIFLEDESLIGVLNLDLFIKSSINSAVIMPENFSGNLPQPYILLTTSYTDKTKYQYISREELLKNISRYVEDGMVHAYTSKGVIDFEDILGFKSAKRIFISNSGIYTDFEMKNKLSNNKEQLSIDSIKNLLSLKSEANGNSTFEAYTYNLIATIGFYLGLGEIIAITPYNHGFLPPKEIVNNRYLGLCSNDGHYIYDTFNKKMFSTNELSMVILEFYIKNQMDSPKLQELVPEKKVIDQFILTLEKLQK